MTSASAQISRKSLIIVFAFAPTGLGHLRVTDALYHGLGADANAVLLGTHDKSVTFFHRLTSVHPIGKAIGEWMQNGVQQDIFTWLFKVILRSDTYLLYEQLSAILEQRLPAPDHVLIVATHFALAHQFGVVKAKIEKEKHIKVSLVVVVTDDSPQHVWYVPEADMICVPSIRTKRELQRWAKRKRLTSVPVQVMPYPINPLLTRHLPPDNYTNRCDQLDPQSRTQIHVSIPVSGAAAGIAYHLKLIDLLHQNQHRFYFHLVSRANNYTLPFLTKLLEKPYIKVSMSPLDRQVVDLYDQLFEDEVISLEITKPSEQAFKAILGPHQKGGVVLLLSPAFGRQERDNIKFLRRHKLIPTENEQNQLFNQFGAKQDPDLVLMQAANKWRGIELPTNSKISAEFIVWCLQAGLLHNMSKYKKKNHISELSSSGVATFWSKVDAMLKEVRT